MAINFPRAWQIARDSKMEDHHPECSYKQTEGALLCDCDIIYKHPDYLSKDFIGKDGEKIDNPAKGD